MLGAIAGDIVGSVYEGRPIKQKGFPLFGRGATFTDDSVLTVATADVLLYDGDYREAYKGYFRRHPHRGFGGNFALWAASDDPEPYGSFGNGSAMRVGPVGWARTTLDEVLVEAQRSAQVTHNHPEGIKGAQATAAAVFLARARQSKADIRAFIEERFEYDLDRWLDDIRPGYTFDVSCQGSVPEAIIAFLEAEDFEDAIRNAVSLGGDSDTQACIAGAIAEACYGLPAPIEREVMAHLDADLTEVTRAFRTAYVA
ncbi:MAG: ADP-ribosylglycohydrolase family protein [Gammaproteobacteria bacterium]|nr:ADP-ribosylglycohydrolase family protein [Gammaproteobacteria bacterium]NIR82110.1 ADP-ribosylglycohydrolase family protein [Gammaproteobacteria bacterium]NIR89343.1 ADP-ribosylglycohydrolase family protein [Gammaproteobacteria bacterium]NIU03220.1 ADP-ribosylglycohydrolase family protein [Gammaproteobacteria bacterium]NIV74515.1 ADP-ribosylglycohydrolase family protein [Gammaproteobacteria bacterium]